LRHALDVELGAGPRADGIAIPLAASRASLDAGDVTAALRPGKYLLTADTPGFTVAPQPLIIGPGREARSPFRVVEYIDGVGQQCSGTWKDGPESVAALIERTRKVGQTLFITVREIPARRRPFGTPEERSLSIAPASTAEQRSLLWRVRRGRRMLLLGCDGVGRWPGGYFTVQIDARRAFKTVKE
jgi:hypothetical protein